MIADAMPAPALASPLAAIFATLGSGLGGHEAPLDEEAMLRLVAEARAGDGDARRSLYLQHVNRVFRTVRGILPTEADAEDATQDAMLTVLTSLHTFRPRDGTRFAAWVTTIAVNTARRRYRRRRPELTATGDMPDLAADGVDPAELVDRGRRRRALLTALAELPERDREIVSLRYAAELNATEIGSAVGLQPAAIRKVLERARIRLAERIDALLRPEGVLS